MMSSVLPSDVMTEIFLRLPAKSLLRFKSVCKLWYNVIRNPDFGKLHLERSLTTHTNQHFVIKTPLMKLCHYEFLEEPIELNFPVYYMADFDTLKNPVELNHPFKNTMDCLVVVGACNGLLCLCLYDDHNDLLLYNPTTQTHHMLPRLPIKDPFRSQRNCDFGFGYDSLSGDYKCVRVLQCLEEKMGMFASEVMVYSLRARAWRRAIDVPQYFNCFNNASSALLHEVVHWVGLSEKYLPHPIVAFSLRDERFSSLTLPCINFEECNYFFVGVLDDCLCLSINYVHQCDLWVMKEYGMTRSWSRMFSFAKGPCDNIQKPVTYSMRGDRLMFKNSLFKVGCLDLESMETTNFKFAHFDRCMDVQVCVENLLMLNDSADGDHVSVEEHQLREKKGKKRMKTRRTRRNKELLMRSNLQ